MPEATLHDPLPAATAGLRIGLLGGSFNPAHRGHLHISRTAIARLGLDQVWWLVSPQNPLKPAAGMAPFAARLAGARALTAADRRIRATGIEARLGTRFTVDTISALRLRWPRVRFVWLMGADILRQMPEWRNWPQIFHILPVAVIDRPSYASRALAGKAALRFARARLAESKAGSLAERRPPAWVFLHGRLDPTSATAIRARRGG